MHFNNRAFGKTDYLDKTIFHSVIDSSPINPPPPGNSIIITESGSQMITELTDSLIITE